MQFRTNSKKVNQRFESSNVEVKIVNGKVEGRNVRYIIVNESQENKPIIMFIHGAPGSSDNYFQFMDDPDLLEKARMVSLDRPGYGYSGFGKSLTSIEDQAKIINSILRDKNSTDQPVLLIGHSFGGPIAAKAAMLDSSNVDGVIMLAPAIDPENEKIFKIAYLGYKPPFRWITPKSWKVAADEKFTHVEELKKMLDDWEKINVPVTHMHGDKDRLVPFENLKFSKRMISKEMLHTIHLEGEDHFLPWTQKDLIKATILESLDKNTGSANRNP